MATIIGLSIRVKLLRSLPPRFKVDVTIAPGTHASELAVNKQLADKERVAAALENAHLLGLYFCFIFRYLNSQFCKLFYRKDRGQRSEHQSCPRLVLDHARRC